jgi:hypothetical protein
VFLFHLHFVEYVKQIELTIDTNLILLNWPLCLGFWNVTNSWKSRWRNSKYSFIWIGWNWKMKNNTKMITLCVIVFIRQRVESVQFVGWLLNQLQTEITARNQMFGHLELLVCELSQFSFHFTTSCDIFVLMSLFTSIIEKFVCFCLVYEIVAQWEPHKDKDVIDVAIRIR